MFKLLRLQHRLSGDHNFKGNTIIGSMCTEPHPIAQRTFKKFLSTNVGDPGLFPNLKNLEREYITTIGSLLHNNITKGMFVSGGSEANIHALWTARTRTTPDKREVILPVTSHFSFDKAANMLGLTLIKIPVDSNHRIRLDLVKKAINPKTMAIVAVAGTTGVGACDPIKELSDIAIAQSIYLHIDAAFGGFVYPFLNKPPLFDFKLAGVMSITIDPHKMGRSVIPGGCILYKNSEVADSIKMPVSYLSGGRTEHNSLLGTRSGAAIASAWMVYNSLGFNKYKKGVDKLLKLTDWFTDEIKNIPNLGVIVEPEINIVGICLTNETPIKPLISSLREKGWAISEWSNFIRIVIMPHVNKRTLKRFIRDIKKLL